MPDIASGRILTYDNVSPFTLDCKVLVYYGASWGHLQAFGKHHAESIANLAPNDLPAIALTSLYNILKTQKLGVMQVCDVILHINNLDLSDEQKAAVIPALVPLETLRGGQVSPIVFRNQLRSTIGAFHKALHIQDAKELAQSILTDGTIPEGMEAKPMAGGAAAADMEHLTDFVATQSKSCMYFALNQKAVDDWKNLQAGKQAPSKKAKSTQPSPAPPIPAEPIQPRPLPPPKHDRKPGMRAISVRKRFAEE